MRIPHLDLLETQPMDHCVDTAKYWTLISHNAFTANLDLFELVSGRITGFIRIHGVKLAFFHLRYLTLQNIAISHSGSLVPNPACH